MSQPAETAPDSRRARRRRKLIVAGALVAVLIAALLTGLPQRLALEYGLRKALLTDVHVRGVSFIPRIRVAELLRFAGSELDGLRQPVERRCKRDCKRIGDLTAPTFQRGSELLQRSHLGHQADQGCEHGRYRDQDCAGGEHP